MIGNFGMIGSKTMKVRNILGLGLLAGAGFFMAYENVKGQAVRPMPPAAPAVSNPAMPYGQHSYWGCLGYCNGPLRPASNYYTCFGYCPTGPHSSGPWTRYHIYAAAVSAAAGANAQYLFPFPVEVAQPQPGTQPAQPAADPKEVERLTKQLQEKEKEKRLQAAQELAMKKAKEAAIPLMGLLKDTDPQVRTHAAQALAQLGKDAVGDVTQGLYSEDRMVRMGSALALGMMGEKAGTALTALKGSLKDSDVRVRGHAAQAIYRISKDSKDVLPVLLECLKDDDEHVRLGVIHALGMMRKDARSAMDALKKSLKDHVAWIRLAASGALWDIAPEPKDNLAKELAPILAELQKEDNPDLRTEVVGLLSQMKSSEAAMALLQKASLDSDSGVGQIATQNLVDNPDSAIEALVKGLASKDVQVRFRSVSTLAQMGERAAKAMPALVETLRDRDVGVRWESALALGRMKANAKDAVRPLTEALEDPAYQVRMMAAEALGEIGSSASSALEALKIAEKDSRAEVVDAARIAIRKITK